MCIRRTAASALALCGFVALYPLAAFAEPYRPTDPAKVVLRLPDDATGQEFRALRMALNADPSAVETRLQLVALYIAAGERTDDSRYIGYADALLTPVLTKEKPPASAYLAKTRILSFRHEYERARAQLDQLLESAPNFEFARWQRVGVSIALGQFDRAQADCDQLAARFPSPLSDFCASWVRSFTGHLVESYRLSTALAQRLPDYPIFKTWSATILAGMAERLGDDSAAEHWLQQALALDPASPSLCEAYADLLLRSARWREAHAILANAPASDSKLLRLAIIEPRIGARSTSRDKLQMRLQEAQLRGDRTLLRERARAALDLHHSPEVALELALQNWQLQHDIEDIRLLAMAAAAAKNDVVLATVKAWRTQWSYEDAVLDRLLSSGSASE